MGYFDDVGQKMKGKLQKAKGNLQQDLSARDDIGMKVKGGISKLKGSFNETAADIKMDSKKPRRRYRRALL
jgi:hypothetical protein